LRQIRLQSSYDLIIIGGGIQGCATFWEAQSRGLNTLLVEEQDFCSQTSANSLKTIHGGIRYLQTLNLARTWRSSKEPETLLKIAPHLVHPLSCLLPTENNLQRSRLAVAIGFGLYNLIKKFSCRTQRLPRARCLSKSQLVSMTGLLDLQTVTGAGLWFDAQAQHTERLGLAFVNAAQGAGGDAHNYLKATSLARTENRKLSLVLNDQIDQQTYQVRTRSVIYCTASSTAQNISLLPGAGIARGFEPRFCLAVNLVANKKYADFAIGMQSGFAGNTQTDSRRLLFSAPWRNSTMYGTWYFQPGPNYDGNQTPSAEQISYCLNDVNQSYPELNLSLEDIFQVHAGLLPLKDDQADPENNLLEHDLIQQPDKSLNVFTVIPTKFTTCRATAEMMIDLLHDKINMPVSRSISAETPLMGGNIGSDFNSFVLKCQQKFQHLLPKIVIDQLCVSYGDQIEEIIRLCELDETLRDLIPGSTNHIKAQLDYELNHGNVFKPGDFTHRRSFLSSDRQINKQTLTYCREKINRYHSTQGTSV